MKVLVLGISGMLGSTAFRVLSNEPTFTVCGSARSESCRQHFPREAQHRICTGLDVADTDALLRALNQIRPDAVLNCVGVVKQLDTAKDPLVALPLNALFPHRLALYCSLLGARLIHVSTDCVFSGRVGAYTEEAIPDANDLYGRSKLLGEVDYSNTITVRTSIIGRELESRNGLLEWFLGQEGKVRGFTRAIFSGLTADELSHVIARHILLRPDLRGVWHVSAGAISKFDLLHVIARTYGRETEIEPDTSLVVDRSLDSARFRTATGYVPPEWPEMIAQMREAENAP